MKKVLQLSLLVGCLSSQLFAAQGGDATLRGARKGYMTQQQWQWLREQGPVSARYQGPVDHLVGEPASARHLPPHRPGVNPVLTNVGPDGIEKQPIKYYFGAPLSAYKNPRAVLKYYEQFQPIQAKMEAASASYNAQLQALYNKMRVVQAPYMKQLNALRDAAVTSGALEFVRGYVPWWQRYNKMVKPYAS